MEKDVLKTLVIFRKFRGGDVIALFPAELVGDHGHCSSYMHVGQHGAANYIRLLTTTVLAAPQEYKTLKKELESLGYNLDVRVKYIRPKQ